MKTITVKIPGKIMLAGEYAVLRGGDCLAFTVDRYMTITVIPQTGRFVLNSDLWQAEVSFSNTRAIDRREPFLDTVAHAANLFHLNGAGIRIKSDLNTSFGIGSSSALRLGVLMGLSALAKGLGTKTGADKVIADAWQMGYIAHCLQKRQQQASSGYDIITQLAGGLLKISPREEGWPGDYEDLTEYSANLPAFVQFWVGGVGAKTEQIVAVTQKWLDDHSLRSKLQVLSAAHVGQFVSTITAGERRQCLPDLIKLTAEHRRLFDSSPFFPKKIFAELAKVPGFDQTWTVKTTGAGGEDALLLIGEHDNTKGAARQLKQLGWYPLQVAFAKQGATIIFDETEEE